MPLLRTVLVSDFFEFFGDSIVAIDNDSMENLEKVRAEKGTKEKKGQKVGRKKEVKSRKLLKTKV